LKPKIAVFDFTSCEGCELQIVNLERDLLAILGAIEIVNFREAISDRGEDYDIAIIEGSASSPECIVRLNKIRRQAKVVFTIGSCASIGGLNSMRNTMDFEDVRTEVYGDNKYYYDSLPKNLPISSVIPVDLALTECPVNRTELVEAIKAVLQGKAPPVPTYSVCVECKMNGNECMWDRGMGCLGPVIRGGCGALCPSKGIYCIGCRGLKPGANIEAMKATMAEKGLPADEIARKLGFFCTSQEESS